VISDTSAKSGAKKLSMLERQQLHVNDRAAHTFWHWVRFALVADVARTRDVDEILDIGAGSGMLGDWMMAETPTLNYRFSELSEPLDRALGEQFGDSARYADDLPITSSTTVAMLDVLEHIENDAAAMTEIAERMEPGTTIVVTVPAMQWAFSSWDTELGHFRRYSRRQLQSVLTDAGLVVESSQYLFPELLMLLPVRKLRRGQRSDVDFPQLSPVVNRVGYWVSATTARLRRWWPVGTSVIAVASKPSLDE
jgi:hypothetical protein